MPDTNKRGGVSFDADEENARSGRGTMAEKGRNEQFTSDQARAEGVETGEVGAPPIEDASKIDQPVPGRGAGGSPVSDPATKPPRTQRDGLSDSTGNEALGTEARDENDVDVAAMAELNRLGGEPR